jgi:hypothetical protein
LGTGWIYFGIENLDIDLVITLDISDDGFIHPLFHDVKVDLGGTYFGFENGFTEFLAW